MQSGPPESPSRDVEPTDIPASPSNTAQHGSGHSRPDLPHVGSPLRVRGPCSDALLRGGGGPASAQPLDGLNNDAEDKVAAAPHGILAGHRIAEYERAALSSAPRSSRPAPVVKAAAASSPPGVQLTDLPNEILTQILSHLHPDSHGAVALLSKRFYALVTTPYAWRAAFLRYFAGQNSVAGHVQAAGPAREKPRPDLIRSEARYFTRLTPLASWRSEYLLRTRLLRSVVRGRPGNVGPSARPSQSGKKAQAVLTYNPKLPWMTSHLDADFAGGKKGPRVIHGTRDLGVATFSDPTTGRVEKWGLDDPFSFRQLDEVFPNLAFYGAGEGPAAVPNVMDVSQQYGFVAGEGFPGGRVYYKATAQLRGRYLGGDRGIADAIPEIPKIPELTDAVSCVWIAKSSAVPSTTQSMVGIMAGSTLGVVTTYAISQDATRPRYAVGDMTARWVLSPGVPIVDIKVDDQYSLRRKSLRRVWAVALNALGEVFYLTDPPVPPAHKPKPEERVKDAWEAGRSVFWELIESTRRTEWPDESGNNVVAGSYSPRSSGCAMNLSLEQIAAESREIEHFFRYSPAHFRRVCRGWDMLRRLEVDFAAGGENGAGAGGESIVVITCGSEEGLPPSVRRFVRADRSVKGLSGGLTPTAQVITIGHRSIFGGDSVTEGHGPALATDGNVNGVSPLGSGASTPQLGFVPGTLEAEEWRAGEFALPHGPTMEITASAIDMSTFATMAAFEDPLLTFSPASSTPATPTSKQATGEIPGRRARLLAIGTNAGSVVVWNMRDTESPARPVRIIQTDSPEVTALAVSALYIVHGGSDSLVQAWDPLASSLEPIRTVNAKSSGRIPRHLLNTAPALQEADLFSVRCIVLDPDATLLRGVLACGTYVRFWSYSTTRQGPGRKRRLRHSDIHGRLASRRNNSTVSSYIAAEEAEMRREQEHRSRELERLRKRFGVGLAELTEEEALQYAQMISEESFALDELRRSSASDAAETASSAGSTTTTATAMTDAVMPPEAGLSGAKLGSTWPVGSSSGPSPLETNPPVTDADANADADYEAQLQMAIRLSLMEGAANGTANGSGSSDPSPSAGSSSSSSSSSSRNNLPLSQADAGFPIAVRTKPAKKKGGYGSQLWEAPSPSSSSFTDLPSAPAGSALSASIGVNEDDDLALALRLSLEEEEARQARLREEEEEQVLRAVRDADEFPPLEATASGKGKGKGKAV
ncbi:hypothetical protein VTJ83DRAFT_5062 [Remersonia thermophila]|uniref:F-box domain-containing protein n=1 Tax=Remersonia thermophila TaxID=72144 RepID=A0ABR4DBR3_9PEZI